MGIAIRNEQSLDLAFKIVFGLSFFLLSCIDNSNNNYNNNERFVDFCFFSSFKTFVSLGGNRNSFSNCPHLCSHRCL